MTPNLIRQRHDRREIRDRPRARRKAGQVDHTTRNGQQEGVHPLEVPHNAIETDAETGGFEFFGRGGPFHIDAEGVAEEGFAHVEGEAAEEEDELGKGLLVCGGRW